MKLVVISDTHGKHNELQPLPDGDVLIHCGDYSKTGNYEQTKDFFDWFDSQSHPHKIVIPGNHERDICPIIYDRINKLYNAPGASNLKKNIFYHYKNYIEKTNKILELIKSYTNIHFLIDEEVVIDDVKFYGTPWCGGEINIMSLWGFYVNSSEERDRLFSKIPDDTDILISHTPPYGILDKAGNIELGCSSILKRVKEVKPIIHLFGHIHEGYGKFLLSDYTQFYNCSNLDGSYNVTNKVTVINNFLDE